MIKISFLAYIPDPFSLGQSVYMLLEPESDARTVSVQELSAYSALLMSYDVPALVDDLRKSSHIPPRQVVDIGDALRLNVGRSKDDGGERHWNVWLTLKGYFDVRADGETFELVATSRVGRPGSSEEIRLLRETLVALRRQWDWLESTLESVGELERLVSVEWPLQSLFAYRQFMGVRVDSAGVRNLLSSISAEKYVAYHTVAQILNKNPSGLNFWNIHPYLNRTDVGHLAALEPGGRLLDAFELAASQSEFAASFLSLVKAGRDEAIVKRAMGEGERVYPIFHVLGTVSGRILVSDPYLQQLRRTYRSLIVPDPDCRLIYLDYAQFEPGVLAGLSEDEDLIAAYNKGDVYSELAESLFGDVNRRPMAKRVFLAFSYGMTSGRIATLLLASDSSCMERRVYATKIDAFFLAFPRLENYRAEQRKFLLEKGFVSSLLGNRRLRNTRGVLTPKEQRWALNHPIQSTASLIFKEALLEITGEFGCGHLILPIHDAVVLQFREDGNFDHNVERATEIMVSAFNRRFPRIRARVTAGGLAE